MNRESTTTGRALCCAALLCVISSALVSRADTPIELASLDTGQLNVPLPASRPSRSCTSCHVVDSTLSHPVEVRATMRVPDALPLAAGRVTCTTCHLDDNQQHALTGGSFGAKALLRTDRRGAAFCANCHTPGSAVGRSHAGRLNRAHLAWPGRIGSATTSAGASPRLSANASFSGVLDEVSRQCMDCHDGSRGTDIGRSHPMGVTYAASPFSDPRRSTARRMVPLNQLDPRIKLVNNTIGCMACHDVYASHQQDLLVMPNPRDELCRSCHAM